MKKVLMMFALMMGFIGAVNAQTAIVDNGTIKDNWYVGGGIGTNVWNNNGSWSLANGKWGTQWKDGNSGWWKTQPLHVNVLIGKMFNPYLGAELDYRAVFNLYGSTTFIDAHNLTGNVVVNLTNIIEGYKGEQRIFELELLGGAGWYHFYDSDYETSTMSVRGAIRGNLNLSSKWAITLTPEYIWLPRNIAKAADARHGVNIAVGAKYRIPSSRSNFPMVKLYDQAEVDALNAKVNALIATNADLASSNANLTKANADLSATIKELIEKGNKVAVDARSVGTVYFEKGKYNVTNTKIASIVDALKNSNGTITLTGTTSPEGSETFNKVLAINRAKAVKDALVASGIDESRISVNDNYDSQRSVVITVQ